jgi:hypothetical protein
VLPWASKLDKQMKQWKIGYTPKEDIKKNKE